MVTMEDIAIELGCSINTVSKALNNKPDVSPKTRKLVVDTARRMGYVPNALAKSLVTKSSGTLGIVVPSVIVSIYAELVEYIMKRASKRGYATFLAISSDSEEEEIEAVRSLYQKRVDGLIVVPVTSSPSYHETMMAFKEPVVYACNTVDIPDAYFVGQKLEDCAYEVTKHLLAQGCQRIALMCSTRAGIRSSVEKGYRLCLEDSCLPVREEDIFRPETSLRPRDSGYEVAKMMDDRIDEFDGVLLETDALYFGLNRLMESHGLSAPDDLLVAAAIGLEADRNQFLSLTSIGIKPEEIGEAALRCLDDQVRNGDDAVKPVPMEGRIIVRRSSRRR